MAYIRLTDQGFTVERDLHVLFAARWEEITRVAGYKKDCITVDQIRFVVSDGAYEIELTEDMQGWRELVAALPERVIGFPMESEWFPKLAQPPFATNFTILFEKL